MNMTQAAYQNDKNALGVTYETAAIVGSRLRQAREEKKLSPSQVSARVKIRDRYIEAIEIGDWDVLPPGLNGRGLIRLYARELSVPIPEFEAFHHLQTVMIEKQSENLMAFSSKKSKYHPAAEESAEVIRSISRSDFQKNANYEQSEYISIPTNTDSSNVLSNSSNQSSKAYSRPIFVQKGVTSSVNSAIITPNIFDVLGIDSAQIKDETDKSEISSDIKKVNQYNKNLPTAEPIKRSLNNSTNIQDINSVNSVNSQNVDFDNNYQSDVIGKKDKKSIIRNRLAKLTTLQIVVSSSSLLAIVIVTIFLFSMNSSQIKVTNLSAKQIEHDFGDSEPLPNSMLSSEITQPQKEEILMGGKTKAQGNVSAENTQSVVIPAQKDSSQTPSVEKVAKLNIISKVNISIEADGQQIYSGPHVSGPIDVPFKNEAEIIISDASKVSLNFEGIDHGTLGYEGRKRRIILNAKPYVE